MPFLGRLPVTPPAETGVPAAGGAERRTDPCTGPRTVAHREARNDRSAALGGTSNPLAAPPELDEPLSDETGHSRPCAKSATTPDSAQGGLLRRIAAVVAAIPPGRVATYGQVAAQAGNRRAARQVAWALRAYAGKGLPWHRVIGAGGAIRLPQGGGLERQRSLLLAEGVAVDPDGRLDLAACQWRP